MVGAIVAKNEFDHLPRKRIWPRTKGRLNAAERSQREFPLRVEFFIAYFDIAVVIHADEHERAFRRRESKGALRICLPRAGRRPWDRRLLIGKSIANL